MKLIDIKHFILASLLNKDDASFDCDRILNFIYHLDKTEITLHAFDEYSYDKKIDVIIHKRNQGIPLEYIIGSATFFGRSFLVNPDCLIPQSDTEIIIEQAVQFATRDSSFIDIGTGSGCIAITLSCETQSHGIAVDISEGALKIAKENAARLGVSHQINFVHDDVLQSNLFWKDKQFNLIMSNPPYIETAVIPSLSSEVRKEPHNALDGGQDGLLFYKHLIPQFKDHLSEDGVVILEIGYDQAQTVGQLLDDNNFSYMIYKDYGGNDRCIVATYRK